MKVNLEQLENSRVKVTVEVGADKLEEGLARTAGWPRECKSQDSGKGKRRGRSSKDIMV